MTLSSLRGLVRVEADEVREPDIGQPVFVPECGGRWGKPANFSYISPAPSDVLTYPDLGISVEVDVEKDPIRRTRRLGATVDLLFKKKIIEEEETTGNPGNITYSFSYGVQNRIEFAGTSFTENLPKKHIWQFGGGTRYWNYGLSFETTRPGDDDFP